MKIFIALSNHLLSLSLKDLLKKAMGDLKVYTEDEEIPSEFIPDVLIMNFYGLRSEKARQFGFENSRVLLLDTGLTNEEIQASYIFFKGAGILPQNTSTALLIKSLQAVVGGEIWIANKTVKDILQSQHSSMFQKIRSLRLTPREE